LFSKQVRADDAMWGCALHSHVHWQPPIRLIFCLTMSTCLQ